MHAFANTYYFFACICKYLLFFWVSNKNIATIILFCMYLVGHPSLDYSGRCNYILRMLVMCADSMRQYICVQLAKCQNLNRRIPSHNALMN